MEIGLNQATKSVSKGDKCWIVVSSDHIPSDLDVRGLLCRHPETSDRTAARLSVHRRNVSAEFLCRKTYEELLPSYALYHR